MSKIEIEACVASVASAIAAEEGGADRLELNFALELDGLTPSLGLFNAVRSVCSLPIIVMIRPRGYGFVYSAHEYMAMRLDIDTFMEAGADGFAIGFLKEDGNIDAERTRAVSQQMPDLTCVFHRAFDVTPSPSESLEVLIDCGVDRILTSGHAASVPEGIPVLRDLVKQAYGRIEILPGAGVNPNNIARIISATGCNQVHGTFRSPTQTKHNPAGMDALRAPAPPGTDAAVVAKIRKAVSSI